MCLRTVTHSRHSRVRRSRKLFGKKRGVFCTDVQVNRDTIKKVGSMNWSDSLFVPVSIEPVIRFLKRRIFRVDSAFFCKCGRMQGKRHKKA